MSRLFSIFKNWLYDRKHIGRNRGATPLLDFQKLAIRQVAQCGSRQSLEEYGAGCIVGLSYPIERYALVENFQIRLSPELFIFSKRMGFRNRL